MSFSSLPRLLYNYRKYHDLFYLYPNLDLTVAYKACIQVDRLRIPRARGLLQENDLI